MYDCVTKSNLRANYIKHTVQYREGIKIEKKVLPLRASLVPGYITRMVFQS